MNVLDKIRDIFKELRKRGYLARMNFLCCGSCAGYDLAQMAAKRHKKGKKVEGCVFYTKQDTEGFHRSKKLAIRFGPLDTTECGVLGKPAIEVGREVVSLLREVGLSVDWDGSPNQVIWVSE